ncbi:MAG: hypothetical protein Wins2KO_26300 [Winogradskyella sp.]
MKSKYILIESTLRSSREILSTEIKEISTVLNVTVGFIFIPKTEINQAYH